MVAQSCLEQAGIPLALLTVKISIAILTHTVIQAVHLVVVATIAIQMHMAILNVTKHANNTTVSRR